MEVPEAGVLEATVKKGAVAKENARKRVKAYFNQPLTEVFESCLPFRISSAQFRYR